MSDYPTSAALLAGPAASGPLWRISVARLAAEAGRWDVWDSVLSDFMANYLPSSDDAFDHRITFACLAFEVGRFEHLEKLVEMIFGLSIRIAIDDAIEIEVDSVQMFITDEETRFIFNDNLRQHKYLRVLLKNWLASLWLFSSFKRDCSTVRGWVTVSLGDMGVRSGLAFSDYRSNITLIPDPDFLETKGYNNIIRRVSEEAWPWDEKISKAFWRGSATGWHSHDGKPIKTWRDLPRIVLSQIGRDVDIMDVGISTVVQLPPEASTEIAEAGLLRGFIPLEHIGRYKYQIDIDGNSCAWMSFFVKLASGSPVLKVDSAMGFKQWYYDRLVPWRHYVPVKKDMSDLLDRIRWLEANQSEARRIADNAGTLIRSMSLDAEVSAVYSAMSASFSRSY